METITLRAIDRSNYDQCIALKVREDQKDYVATNVYSLAQASFEPDVYTLGIYLEDTMIGFILYDLDEELAGWCMSRYMIDEKYQGKGYGKKALKEFLDFFTRSHPEAGELYTSAEVDNPVAIALYESLGFVKGEVFTYEVFDKIFREIRMRLAL